MSVLLVSPTFGADYSLFRPSLKGLRQLYVSVVLHDPTNKSGVDASTIQTDVEVKLRQTGLRVISQDDQSLNTAQVQVMVWMIPSLKLPPNPDPVEYAFLTVLSLSQWTYLARDRSIPCWSTTFQVSHMGTSQPSTYIRQAVHDELDTFLNEYLAANPKKSP